MARLTPTQEVFSEDYARIGGEIADARNFSATVASPLDSTGLPDLAEAGETIRGKPVFGLPGDWDKTRAGDNNVRSQLDSGLSHDVSDGVITYAFFDLKHSVGLNNNPSFGEGKGYTPFTAAQKAAAVIAIGNWDELIAPEFVQAADKPGASGWAQQTADILLANTSTGPAQAWAYYPGYGRQYERVAGDVWVADPRFNTSNAQLDPGFYGLQTLNHELGHAIGLSHPGEYNFGDDNDGDGQPDPITFEGDAFYFQDNHQYSIMSYFDSYEAGNNQVDWNLMRFVYPSTPMVHDVAIAQAKYGAEMSTRTGDTTYGFNATADVTNAAMRFTSGEMLTIFTIWDAAGNDTLNLSGYFTDSVIDLREGAYSSAGGFGAYDAARADVDPSTLSKADYLAFVNANNAKLSLASRTAAYDLYFGGREGANEGIAWSDIMGRDWVMENNIGIAYGAVIENAVGGEGDDRINGNQANNSFTGNGGADTFVIANYTGTTAAGKKITDTSIDRILDFDRDEGDKVDLSELGVDFSDLSFNDATDTVTVNADNGVLQFVLVGASSIQQSDFFFG
ncbi:M10 family metallopeptidase [Sphingomonas sp. GCM10030256]|uniref:M10 family metallopeptidase n=1 Tax=Sphingomonas sp. GCM10030256 TaxID=3273427 RepID=UPI00360A57CA